ncbi:efflux RND transporter periplasmic adaptor subunit [Dechloromonas sp. ZY10]|uniref:efflux RND transporter periplasmic adaptor subunit n=1 Tax=Dechloromonas aquae TaxID=2664436 RepID=UPI003529623D
MKFAYLRVVPWLLLAPWLAACGPGNSEAPVAAPAAKPALSVRTVLPQREDWPQRLAASGSVMPWQEAVIGAEVGNQRIAEVLVQVGDSVRKGQALARIDAAALQQEVAEARAGVAELEAATLEARANAERARALRAQGFYSPQTAVQYQTAEGTATARLAAARARLAAAELRLAKSQVLAPDAGVISARTATVGSLPQNGDELFRLIRGGRLEWRAEVPADDLPKLRPGASARLRAADGSELVGKVRSVAPSVDPQTRNGLVYVDLPRSTVTRDENPALRAGAFARGEFDLGAQPALTLPQAAVVLREGFAYVFRLDSGGTRVIQSKVELGRRQGERIEILAGLPADASVVASGVGFLADGDVVQLLPAETAR